MYSIFFCLFVPNQLKWQLILVYNNCILKQIFVKLIYIHYFSLKILVIVFRRINNFYVLFEINICKVNRYSLFSLKNIIKSF